MIDMDALSAFARTLLPGFDFEGMRRVVEGDDIEAARNAAEEMNRLMIGTLIDADIGFGEGDRLPGQFERDVDTDDE